MFHTAMCKKPNYLPRCSHKEIYTSRRCCTGNCRAFSQRSDAESSCYGRFASCATAASVVELDARVFSDCRLPGRERRHRMGWTGNGHKKLDLRAKKRVVEEAASCETSKAELEVPTKRSLERTNRKTVSNKRPESQE